MESNVHIIYSEAQSSKESLTVYSNWMLTDGRLNLSSVLPTLFGEESRIKFWLW